MKSKAVIYIPFILLIIFCFSEISFAQAEPVLYFCERYENQRGEVNISDRFTTGSLTVMVRSENELGLNECYIKIEKWNAAADEFELYKLFKYNVEPDMKYIFFSKNEESDMRFEEAGFYRVSLLDEIESPVASALIEIVKK
jgi:hypothetical protein